MRNRPPYVLPAWMEPYRTLFQNTGGNTIEDLMTDNDPTNNGANNVVRAALIASVEAQLTLLWRMRQRGMLVGVAPDVGDQTS